MTTGLTTDVELLGNNRLFDSSRKSTGIVSRHEVSDFSLDFIDVVGTTFPVLLSGYARLSCPCLSQLFYYCLSSFCICMGIIFCSFIAPGGRHTQQRTLSKWLNSASADKGADSRYGK